MAFYYQFVVPNRSFIELGRRMPLEQALAAHFSEYVSMNWEKLCRGCCNGKYSQWNCLRQGKTLVGFCF